MSEIKGMEAGLPIRARTCVHVLPSSSPTSLCLSSYGLPTSFIILSSPDPPIPVTIVPVLKVLVFRPSSVVLAASFIIFKTAPPPAAPAPTGLRGASALRRHRGQDRGSTQAPFQEGVFSC